VDKKNLKMGFGKEKRIKTREAKKAEQKGGWGRGTSRDD